MDSELREKLKKFKQKVGNKHHWKYWKSIDELKANVLSSLSMAFVMNPQKGWVKAGGIEKSELLEKLVNTQNELDKVKADFNKFKVKSSFNQHPLLELGEQEFCLTIISQYYNHESINIKLSWIEVFLIICEKLIHRSRISERTFNARVI